MSFQTSFDKIRFNCIHLSGLMIILGMTSTGQPKSVGIVWTTYHYYVGEIATLLSRSNIRVVVYLFLESNEIPFSNENVIFKNISKLPHSLLLNEIEKENHHSVIICGWHIRFFRKLARKLNSRNILFMDNPWKGTVRQCVGSILFRLFWLRHYDGVVVPGVPQENFAQILGFRKKEIQTGFFSFLDISERKNINETPTREFIFIGRLIEWKGVRELVEAFEIYSNKVVSPWPLIVCGDGELRDCIIEKQGIHTRGFLSKEDLFSELRKRRVFISCGLEEHWGISTYEATFFGHPLILSSDSGAASAYLEEGKNGVSIKGRQVGDILKALLYYHNLPDSQLEMYSEKSMNLASRHDSYFFQSNVRTFILGEK